jgi:hypothetical protein
MPTDAAIVKQITRRYGPVIDVRQQPEVIIEIIRTFGPLLDDGGTPGGAPSPPPGPSSIQAGEPGIREVMKELLKLQRQVAKIAKQLDA